MSTHKGAPRTLLTPQEQRAIVQSSGDQCIIPGSLRSDQSQVETGLLVQVVALDIPGLAQCNGRGGVSGDIADSGVFLSIEDGLRSFGVRIDQGVILLTMFVKPN